MILRHFARTSWQKCLQKFSSGTSRFIHHKSTLATPTSRSSTSKTGIQSNDIELPSIEEAKDPWKVFRAEFDGDVYDLPPRQVDFLVIGGGLIGWSTAYWLSHVARCIVAVVERDPAYRRASSVLGLGAIHQQFSEGENIQMSLFAADFMRNIRRHLTVLDLDPPNIKFCAHGHLKLATDVRGAETLEANVAYQQRLGGKVELLTSNMLSELWPWLRVDDVLAGSHGFENEGWFDPWALLLALKRKAASNGVFNVSGEVIGFRSVRVTKTAKDPETGSDSYSNKLTHALVRLNSPPFTHANDPVDKSGGTAQPPNFVQPISFSKVVNAAGAWASEVANMAGIGDAGYGGLIPLPVKPVKQDLFVVNQGLDGSAANQEALPRPGIDCPFIIDPSGMNLRRDRFAGDFLVYMDRVRKLEPQSPLANLERVPPPPKLTAASLKSLQQQEAQNQPINSDYPPDKVADMNFNFKMNDEVSRTHPIRETQSPPQRTSSDDDTEETKAVTNKNEDDELNVDYETFEKLIRPELEHRIPSMAGIQVRSGWAAFTDLNYVDGNLIIGTHPFHPNMLFCNGSSGCGIMHSVAIGRALSELAFWDRYRTIDLRRFSFDRFYEDLPIFEQIIS